MARQDWVLATGNAGKLREFQQRFSTLDVQLRPQSAFGQQPVEETGCTFVENALLKARAASLTAGRPALADDSGLCVAALNGRPGVHSARYAGEPADDARNNARLLEALGGESDRRAQFCCALVWLAFPEDPLPVIAQATWPGQILHEPRGEQGFGYDPLFFLPEFDRTSAELEPETKNAMSHRGQAIDLLLPQVEARISNLG